MMAWKSFGDVQCRNRVIISPHVYPASVTHLFDLLDSNVGSSFNARLSSSFGYLAKQVHDAMERVRSAIHLIYFELRNILVKIQGNMPGSPKAWHPQG